MRETKFRGYSTKYGKWVYGDLITACDNYYIAIKHSIEDVKDNHCDVLGYVNCSNYDDYKDDKKIFEVEANSIGEYIGLKDKNNKDIYEGDIVNFAWIYPKRIEKMLVVWNSSKLQYQYKGEDGILYDISAHINPNDYIEVIGNIYENPELCNKNWYISEEQKNANL